MALQKNVFFDINKFPPVEGILLFPISMSRVSNPSQNAKTYWEYIEHFNPSKIDKTKSSAKVGAIFIYGDFLYLYSNEKACELKKKFMNLVATHKNAFQKLLQKDKHVIHDAFSYKVWNQFYLDNGKFLFYFKKIQELYQKDEKFQKYLKEDFDKLNNPNLIFDENQINFFLEEHLLFYLIAKGQMKLENAFINNNEKWILTCYPGRPMKGHIYLYQINPFKFEMKMNRYQDCWYDLEEKKLYDFTRIDLDAYEY